MTFYEVFKAVRLYLETWFACLIFVFPIAEKKKNFVLRFVVSVVAIGGASLLFSYLLKVLRLDPNIREIFLYGELLLQMVFALFMIRFCFSMTYTKWLFCCFAGHILDTLKGMIIMLVEHSLAGELFNNYHRSFSDIISGNAGALAIYIIVRYSFIALFYWGIWRLLAKNWKADDNVSFINTPLSIISYSGVMLTFFVLTNLSARLLYSQTQYFRYLGLIAEGIGCIMSMMTIYGIRNNNYLKTEKKITDRIIYEKQAQYKMLQSNIDLINRKCHDIKHQINAIKLMSEQDRSKEIAELSDAVKIYDSSVNTGNEVLNVILMEKLLQCESEQIRLSFNATANDISFIETVDIYVLFGNAVDNAIEAVRKYEDPSKRVIGINIKTNGSFLCIMVYNYCEDRIEIKDGLPVTTKENKDYHGFGLKSIRAIAEKYKGEVCVSTDNKTFSLYIGIPLKD